MINDVLKDAESRMKGAIHSLEENLQTIRTGRANPALVEKLVVDYYDTPTPLYQLATINVPEPMMLTIKPFDKSSLHNIEKAIQTSELGLNPSNDGTIIRLPIPPLTTERRRELVKVVHQRLEEAKIALRNVRRGAIDDLREFEKESLISEDESHRGQEEVQKLTDHYTEMIDSAGKHKEQDIMAI
ncbi:MAG TPA: ribosome recycling factor [Aggregatilineales bacterium]|nr:ribosome recycling factor [Aggregatilineales bacterium]